MNLHISLLLCFCSPDAVPDSLASGPQALGASSMSATSAMVSTAAANVPIASSLATPENSVYSGAPLYGIATPMDGGAPRNLPMPTKRLDLGGAVYPLYSQMDARKRSFSNWVEDQGLPAVDELITLGFFYSGLILRVEWSGPQKGNCGECERL